MIFDAANETTYDMTADICICGAGPAGLTLARHLARNNIGTVLIEGGGLHYSEKSQELYTGISTGLPYQDLAAKRLRFFGGSSNHWTGHCGELDPQDFIKWGFHPLSGWPIAKSTLDPYASSAMEILDLGSLADAKSKEIKISWPSPYFHTWTLLESPPTRFGAKYAKEINSSKKNYVCA